jgi:hypothetical protein
VYLSGLLAKVVKQGIKNIDRPSLNNGWAMQGRIRRYWKIKGTPIPLDRLFQGSKILPRLK